MNSLPLEFPSIPEFGEKLPAANPSPETVRLLLQRRSTTAKTMVPPGPTDEQLATLLACGVRVPDHGKLAPWRYLIFSGESREAMGRLLEKIAVEKTPDLSPALRDEERNRFLRAPTVVAVISCPLENHKIPVWEQLLSAGAVCQTMLIAANALGLAAQWLTEWYAYDPQVQSALGLRENENVAGFLYFASSPDPVMERKRPDISSLISHWTG